MPQTRQQAEILAATGPLAADLLGLQPTEELEVVLALVHGAIQIGTADVLPFLARLASDDRLEVREALRGGLSRFDHDEYERVVLAALAGGGARMSELDTDALRIGTWVVDTAISLWPTTRP